MILKSCPVNVNGENDVETEREGRKGECTSLFQNDIRKTNDRADNVVLSKILILVKHNQRIAADPSLKRKHHWCVRKKRKEEKGKSVCVSDSVCVCACVCVRVRKRGEERRIEERERTRPSARILNFQFFDVQTTNFDLRTKRKVERMLSFERFALAQSLF